MTAPLQTKYPPTARISGVTAQFRHQGEYHGLAKLIRVLFAYRFGHVASGCWRIGGWSCPDHHPVGTSGQAGCRLCSSAPLQALKGKYIDICQQNKQTNTHK